MGLSSIFHRKQDDVMGRGNVGYFYDSANEHSNPALGDVNGIPGQRVTMTFYPGATALSGGMVISGSVTGAATVTTAGSATTVWSGSIAFAPKEIGKIDGVTTGGIISGQITVGMIGGAAATTDAKVTFVVGNSGAGTANGAVALALSAATSIGGTTEVFQTFDIPRLLSTTACNSVPLECFVGFQSSKAAASCSVIGRIVASSYILLDVVPGT